MEELLNRLEKETGSGVCCAYRLVYKRFVGHIESYEFSGAMEDFNDMCGFLWGLALAGLVTESERVKIMDELFYTLKAMNG